MRWKPHVRFGGRGQEDLRLRGHKASCPRPNWEDHGPTDTANLVALCSAHHRLHHRGRLGIEGNADDPNGVVFTDQRGRRLTGVGRPAPPGQLRLAGNWVHPSGERLESHWVYFNEPVPRN